MVSMFFGLPAATTGRKILFKNIWDMQHLRKLKVMQHLRKVGQLVYRQIYFTVTKVSQKVFKRTICPVPGKVRIEINCPGLGIWLVKSQGKHIGSCLRCSICSVIGRKMWSTQWRVSCVIFLLNFPSEGLIGYMGRNIFLLLLLMPHVTYSFFKYYLSTSENLSTWSWTIPCAVL